MMGLVPATLLLTAASCSNVQLQREGSVVESVSMAPNPAVRDTSGRVVHLLDFLGDGPLVVVFYRGHW